MDWLITIKLLSLFVSEDEVTREDENSNWEKEEDETEWRIEEDSNSEDTELVVSVTVTLEKFTASLQGDMISTVSPLISTW